MSGNDEGYAFLLLNSSTASPYPAVYGWAPRVSILKPGILRHIDILLNCALNVREGLLLGSSLRPAARQTGARDAVTFLGVAENDAIVCHGVNGTPVQSWRQQRYSSRPIHPFLIGTGGWRLVRAKIVCAHRRKNKILRWHRTSR